jgi:hypothetical protein
MRDKFIEGSTVGSIEVEMDDGSKKVVHRKEKLKCADGVDRVAEDAFACGVDVILV